MGLRAIGSVPLPNGSGVVPADLVRLCPGCDTPMEEPADAGPFRVQDCPRCGLSLMVPRIGRR